MRRLGVVAVLAGVLLAGCAPSYPGYVMDDLDLETARETTHRDLDEALALVPADAARLRSAAGTDEDVACGASDTNPEGTIRHWRYNVLLLLNDGYDRKEIHAKIVDQLVGTGKWKISIDMPAGRDGQARDVQLLHEGESAGEGFGLAVQANADNSITFMATSPCFRVED